MTQHQENLRQRRIFTTLPKSFVEQKPKIKSNSRFSNIFMDITIYKTINLGYLCRITFNATLAALTVHLRTFSGNGTNIRCIQIHIRMYLVYIHIISYLNVGLVI